MHHSTLFVTSDNKKKKISEIENVEMWTCVLEIELYEIFVELTRGLVAKRMIIKYPIVLEIARILLPA